ncbi:hypothetical protein ACF3DV_25775 [Chlorogloeopsis fritschii PCC 9212]|uniref:hypothetical protein n=1 Tax=Chlorogloeopsis fritschii TaxID=1124 RepID=UPI0002E42623|nr:hypothetical protein [Chlorogloeopsis fritschii]
MSEIPIIEGRTSSAVQYLTRANSLEAKPRNFRYQVEPGNDKRELEPRRVQRIYQ